MAEITFTIANYTSNSRQANGTLSWASKNLSEEARSGPFGNGFLPVGTYTARRVELLDKSDAVYKDAQGLGWMQAMRPTFTTPRTDLGIHPDGNVPGTEGCIGLNAANTRPWYEAFRSVSDSIRIEVRNASANLASHALAAESAEGALRRLNVAVVGSAKASHAEADSAHKLGEWLASRGYNLIAGGGGGVMKAVAKGFCTVPPNRRGVSIGIIPGAYENEEAAQGTYTPKRGSPNAFVEVPIYTHLIQSGSLNYTDKIGPKSRNHLTALSADVMVVVGGGDGTRAEASIAVAAKKSVIFFVVVSDWHAAFEAQHSTSRSRDLQELADLLK